MKLSLEIPYRLSIYKDQRADVKVTLVYGDQAKLDDPRFREELGALGMWQPLEFYKKYSSGIYMLGRYDADKIPVLFVHGISGYPQEFRELIAGLDQSQFQPWVLQYPSGLPIEKIADGTRVALDLLRRRLVRENANVKLFDQLVVVAHSMGGLVAQRFIRDDAALDREHYISCLVTIAAPLGGMPSADAGVKHAPSVVPSWRDIAKSSTFIEQLFKKPLPPYLEHYLYFGYGGSTTFGSEASDGTVPLFSQLRLEGMREAFKMRGYDDTHEGIMKDPVVAAQLNEDIVACTSRRAAQLRAGASEQAVGQTSPTTAAETTQRAPQAAPHH